MCDDPSSIPLDVGMNLSPTYKTDQNGQVSFAPREYDTDDALVNVLVMNYFMQSKFAK